MARTGRVKPENAAVRGAFDGASRSWLGDDLRGELREAALELGWRGIPARDGGSAEYGLPL
jgi:hypothetical protein